MSGTWATVGRSAGARILVLPISAILGILITRLLIEHYGVGAFSQYQLLVAIAAMLPFADLGISAAVITVVGQSDDPARDDRVDRVLVTAVRGLTVSAIVLTLICVVISLTGTWRTLLGGKLMPDSGPTAALLCGVLIAIALPIGFGQRILTGLHRAHVTVLLQSIATPVVLLVLLTFIWTGANLGGYVAVAAYAGTFVGCLVMTIMASRAIRPAVGRALGRAWRLRTVRGGGVYDTAWPMLVQMIAMPIAMQSDRVILSHVSDLDNMGQYNIGAQIYMPVVAVIGAAGYALWPVFARARADSTAQAPSPMKLAKVFGLAAAAICLVLGLAAPLLAKLASGGEIQLGVWLIVAFSVLTVMQALKYPLGMYLTDPRGMRFQAVTSILFLIANLGISLVLAIHFGAIGPVIGSALAVLVFQVLANWWWARREMRRAATSS